MGTACCNTKEEDRQFDQKYTIKSEKQYYESA